MYSNLAAGIFDEHMTNAAGGCVARMSQRDATRKAFASLLVGASLLGLCQLGSAETVNPKQSHVARKSTKSVAPTLTPANAARPSAIDPTDLTDEQLALASQVLVGHIECSLGISVTITPDVPVPGKFLLETPDSHFIMHPVASKTGAIRLESYWAGAIWIQVANKSLLVSDINGSRLADDCLHPQQAAAAQAMANMPGILD